MFTLIAQMRQKVYCCLCCQSRWPISHLWMSATNCHSDYPRCKTKNHSRSVDGHLLNWAETVSLLFVVLKEANISKTNNHVPNTIFCNWHCDIWMWSEIDKPEKQNPRLEPTGPAKQSETHQVMVPCTSLTGQEVVSQGFKWVSVQTKQFLQCKS